VKTRKPPTPKAVLRTRKRLSVLYAEVVRLRLAVTEEDRRIRSRSPDYEARLGRDDDRSTARRLVDSRDNRPRETVYPKVAFFTRRPRY
jgi:hypothetical protein